MRGVGEEGAPSSRWILELSKASVLPVAPRIGNRPLRRITPPERPGMSEVTVIAAPAPMTGELQAGRWLDAALDDLRHARHAEEGGFHSHACFSSRQAAVNAVHYARGARTVLGHSVQNLIERLEPRIPELDEMLDDARELDLHYIPTRYPNGLEDWTPAAGFGARQAARAIAGASAIVTVARRHVPVG